MTAIGRSNEALLRAQANFSEVQALTVPDMAAAWFVSRPAIRREMVG
jgi:hypothetical protein